MLVLRREDGEGIVIRVDRPTTLRVVQIVKGKQTKLGVDADPDVLVLRDELADLPADDQPRGAA